MSQFLQQIASPLRVGLEAIFVGAYTLLLFIIIQCIFEKPIYLVLFVLGCAKHFFGYLLGLQSKYCQLCSQNKHAKMPTILETLGEGVLFLVVELLIHSIFTNIYINIFMIGFLLHIGFEYVGIHKWFCKTHCI